MKFKSNKTVIIIPTYNERGNIGKLITKIFNVLSDAKVVVVDDSPNTDSLNEVRKISKKYPFLEIITRKHKGGRGSAVITGFAYALKKFNVDFLIEMDADFSHDPGELMSILNSSGPENIVVASRYISGSKIINWPIERRIASKISNLLVRIILGIPLHDNTNGYRCYPKKAVKSLLSKKFLSSGHIVLSESAYLLMRDGYHFVEVPSVFHNRMVGRSNANILEFLKAFVDLLRIRLRR